MALRCERCRTADLTLVSFGIYQCPNCGRVDADGNVLEAHPGEERADSTQPNLLLDTGRASFAAPPPMTTSPIASGLPAVPSPSGSTAQGGVPGVFLATLAVVALLDLVSAIASHDLLSALGLAFYVPLLTGKSWARTLSMAGAVLTIGLCAMGFVMVHGNPTLRIALLTLIVANAWWLYVLLRADTVAYFSR